MQPQHATDANIGMYVSTREWLMHGVWRVSRGVVVHLARDTSGQANSVHGRHSTCRCAVRFAAMVLGCAIM